MLIHTHPNDILLPDLVVVQRCHGWAVIDAGDEMRLRHSCPSAGSRGPWQATGLVVKLDDASEEVALELKQEAKPPTDTTVVRSCFFLSIVCHLGKNSFLEGYSTASDAEPCDGAAVDLCI